MVYGRTIQEQWENARAAIICKVKEIYQDPPNLLNCYPSIREIPLDAHCQQSTQSLCQWLAWVKLDKNLTSVLL
jgi:ABC-type dipeptide/oligopeptide/nickel transport system ATPase subunit